MIIWVVGYLLGAAGTFFWIVSRNWVYCNGLEDCLLTLVGNAAWGIGWPIYWTLLYF